MPSSRPGVRVVGDRVFVTDPASSSLVRVDLATGGVAERSRLPHVPNEIAGVQG